MEMTATVTYDTPALRALALATAFRGKSPLPRIILMVLVWAMMLPICFLPLFQGTVFRNLAYILAVIGSVLLLAYLFLFAIGPALTCRQRKKQEIGEIALCFTYDAIRTETICKAGTEKLDLQWQGLHRVMESDRYFFLFVNKNAALIVEKSAISGGSANDLRAMALSHAGLKFIRCKF